MQKYNIRHEVTKHDDGGLHSILVVVVYLLIKHL